ncbi:MAG: hypothetical protein ACREJC_23140 [Tepidisphaeraceae bacterium]
MNELKQTGSQSAGARMMKTCPHCHGILPPATNRKPRQAPVVLDVAGLSDDELYKHYHETAPVEDLRFFLAFGVLSDDLRSQAQALLSCATGYKLNMPRGQWMRRLSGLHEQWRLEGPARDAAKVRARRQDRRLAVASRMAWLDTVRNRFARHLEVAA